MQGLTVTANSPKAVKHMLTGPLLVSLNANEDEMDSESGDDFLSSVTDLEQQCEQVIIALENLPNNTEIMHQLFSLLHKLKTDLILAGVHSLVPLAQRIEDILYLVKTVKISYSTSISDLILLSLDLTKLLLTQRISLNSYRYAPDDYQKVCDALYKITNSHDDNRESSVFEAILLLDPNTSLKPQVTETVGNAVVLHPQSNLMSILDEFGVHFNDDLRFFQGLMYAFEKRSRYWEGRHERLLHIALMMNAYAHNPVTPNQLTAAVYMHDIGMAFMPLSILHKDGKLNAEELKLIRTHPQVGHDMLIRMAGWDEAAEIVLHHHERFDGTGYPDKLKNGDISKGAEILAIADTFDARTHEHVYSKNLKRPFIRSILELNQCAGNQLDEHWVNIFNVVIKKLHSHHFI